MLSSINPYLNKTIHMQVIFYIISLFFLCDVCSSTLRTYYPPSDEWVHNWNKVCLSNYLHPQIRESSVNINIIKGDGYAYQVNLINKMNNKSIGSINVDDSGEYLLGFQLYPPFVSNEDLTKGIQSKDAENIATQFLKEINILGDENYAAITSNSKNLDGNFTVTLSYHFEDVEIRCIHIQVDKLGYVVEYDEYDLSRNLRKDVRKELKKSIGKDTMKKLLKDHYSLADNIEISSMDRIVDFNRDLAMKFFWLIRCKRKTNGISEVAAIKYDEADNIFSAILWKREDVVPPRSGINYNAHPLFSSDGKRVWWEGNYRWYGFPTWITAPPVSLVTTSQGENIYSIYRPIIDKGNFLYYHFPSLSPDNRWLVFTIKDLIIIEDMKNNIIFPLRDNYNINSRVSWSYDNKKITFADSDQGKVIIANFQSSSGIPFEDKVTILPVKEKCLFSEFIPGRSDQIVICTVDNNEAILKKVILSEDFKIISSETLLSLKEYPTMLHIMPNGKYLIYSNSTDLVKYDLLTKESESIGWSKSKEFIKDYIITFDELDWDISPDCKEIVFNVVLKSSFDEAICRSSLEGKNIRVISNDNTRLSNRMKIDNKYLNVEMDLLPLFFLKRLGYIDTDIR